MARQRIVKSEIWASEQFAELSPRARLLFVGLLNFSDDAGRHTSSARRLKAEIFPADSVSIEDVAGYLTELIDVGLVVEYSAQGRALLQVTGWDRHQRVERPTVRYPGPLDDGSEIIRGAIDEYSPSARPEEKRREGKGREGKGSKPRKSLVPPSLPSGESAQLEKGGRARAGGRDHFEMTPGLWFEAREWCKRKFGQGQTAPFHGRLTAPERESLLKLGALAVAGVLPEAWIDDALEALRHRADRPKDAVAYLIGVLTQNHPETKARLAKIVVPSELSGRGQPT